VNTYRIHIQGIVQGVGFRPLVYRIAKKMNIQGTVSNSGDGVVIHCTSCPTCVETFVDVITKHPPEKAVITHVEFSETKSQEYSRFSIIESSDSGNGELRVTPDYAICPDCMNEVLDPKNRRFHYPFITCTNCGPRYSIITKMPYDRHLTTMEPFHMCESCTHEYNDPTDRRFYSQTNSCADCGISIAIVNQKGVEIDVEKINNIEFISRELAEGKIIALKGIGGYMLLADARNTTTIQTLRERKKRPHKPFALMVENSAELKKIADPTDYELHEWDSESAPIVLVKTKKNTHLPIKDIAPGLMEVGIMKAYTALHVLICREFGHPLIATSGNISGSPIIYSDKDALMHLSKVADYIVTHNREITIPQDDSVVRFTESAQKITIRRSRGLAPNFFSNSEITPQAVLAVGAMLKSAFTLTKNKIAYISQYLGATNSFETQREFTHVYNHVSGIVDFEPEVVLADSHPGYFTTEWAEDLAVNQKLQLHKIQHHEAHFCSVLGEHNLWAEDVLGFVWDGTGLGTDGMIWGGETMGYSNNTIERIGHFPYFTHILGDKMVNEPRISAFSIFNEIEGVHKHLNYKFTSTERSAYQKLLIRSELKSSSIGRLFDAVSSLLGLCDVSTYHGQAAMLLEAKATEYSGPKLHPYPLEISTNELRIDDMLRQLVRDINLGKSTSEIAFRFHLTLAELVAQTARQHQVPRIAFSGGVFQNKLLVELIRQTLRDSHQLYFHNQLSPNDECISYGQLMHYQNIHKNHLPFS
jgi:hydrogenase maturation protein HypF